MMPSLSNATPSPPRPAHGHLSEQRDLLLQNAKATDTPSDELPITVKGEEYYPELDPSVETNMPKTAKFLHRMAADGFGTYTRDSIYRSLAATLTADLAAYADFLRSVTACCDAALAGVVPAPKAPDLPVGCYISADVPPDVASYATPLLRYLRHYVVIDTASTLGVIRDLSFDDTRHYRVTFSHLHKTWSAYLARAAVRDWVRLHPITTDFDLTPEVLADR